MEGSDGSGAAPLPVASLNCTVVSSALGSIPRAPHAESPRPLAMQKFAIAIPKELLPVTWLCSTTLSSAARTRMLVPDGTAQTSSLGSRQVLALLLARTSLCSRRARASPAFFSCAVSREAYGRRDRPVRIDGHRKCTVAPRARLASGRYAKRRCAHVTHAAPCGT